MNATQTFNHPHSNHVVAVFADSMLAFELPRGATLEDLAARLAYLGERHAGTPLEITVRTPH